MAIMNNNAPVISLNRLSKTFGQIKAVDNLTFEIPRGGVIGFVGPNGAGKSTTMRMLLGLIKPTGGDADILGHPINQPATSLGKVGALIETPSFYPALSGKANLQVIATLGGYASDSIQEVLKIVGLAERSTDKVSGYSHGMKQRLGIAAALLPDPELLVLDEPTNGLDPAGIVEIRHLLRRLGDNGKTVFVSSHLLSEVEAEADRIIIINKGHLIFAGELEDLLKQAHKGIYIRPENAIDKPRLISLITEAGYSTHENNGEQIIVEAPTDWSAELNRLASNNGITLRELKMENETLEDVFLRLTYKEEVAI